MKISSPQQISGIKKGQQLTMPMARSEETPDILDHYDLDVIDLRINWIEILDLIYSNTTIQKAMEESYRDFQEGFKLKDFKHRNGIKGAWKFDDVNNGIYPYTLTTTNWVNEYEEKEWKAQATETECEALTAISQAIEKSALIENGTEIQKNLEISKNKLLIKYPPRPNQPETWRPQNAPHWTAIWIKGMAEVHFSDLTEDWRLVAGNNHCIVAGFGKQKTAYLIDMILMTTNPNEIINELKL